MATSFRSNIPKIKYSTTHGVRNSFINFYQNNGHTVVPSSNLVPESDESLLFNVAGMCQFKNYFLNPNIAPYGAATSVQKCLRIGGKHNDLDNIGKTSRHQTFFEMLGNFSFGQYSRRDAINFAWNFLTKELELPKDRLFVSVLCDDEETIDIWKQDIGFTDNNIFRNSVDENFWSMAPTSGPCGPCTEIFWDQLEQVDGDRYLEIWNLVFMKFEQSLDPYSDKIVYTPLKKQCIDTGMGLERITSIIQNVPTNFDIDCMMPMREAIARILMQEPQMYRETNYEILEVSVRVIMDHVRAISMLIAEGVLPDGKKRGSVLRRLIRRAIVYGYKIGIRSPFLASLIPVFASQSGGPDWFPELSDGMTLIINMVQLEEKAYFSNFDKVNIILEKLKESQNENEKKVLKAEDAFMMYNSMGIPLDLLVDTAEENGTEVDLVGFHKMKEKSKLMSKSSWVGSGDAGLPSIFLSWQEQKLFPNFVGHSTLTTTTKVIGGYIPPKQESEGTCFAWLALEECPFYPESGGQVGDIGFISMTVGDEYFVFNVCDTMKPYNNGIAVKIEHHTLADLTHVVQVGAVVECSVDVESRKCIAQSHSACHLLHSVLRNYLGSHVYQAGSRVDRGFFRLDFVHHTPINPRELNDIEDAINQAIYSDMPVHNSEMPYVEAKKKAIGLFGERYTESVRVVEIEGWSKEICCGTHVNTTGEIGSVKIVSESSVSKGRRRIECYVGKIAIVDLQKKARKYEEIANQLHLSADYFALQKKIESLVAENTELKSKLSKALTKADTSKLIERSVNFNNLCANIYELPGPLDVNSLRKYSQNLLIERKGTGLQILVQENYVVLMTGDDSVADCGKTIKLLLKSVEGKGGGSKKFSEGKFTKIDAAIISNIFEKHNEEYFEF